MMSGMTIKENWVLKSQKFYRVKTLPHCMIFDVKETWILAVFLLDPSHF